MSLSFTKLLLITALLCFFNQAQARSHARYILADPIKQEELAVIPNVVENKEETNNNKQLVTDKENETAQNVANIDDDNKEDALAELEAQEDAESRASRRRRVIRNGRRRGNRRRGNRRRRRGGRRRPVRRNRRGRRGNKRRRYSFRG